MVRIFISCDLYLAHTRPQAERYENGVFGSCLRVYCSSTRLVPCGRSDMPGVDTVKLYCPNCNDIYTPSSSRYGGVDGAFFGTTFAHLFFHTYREYAPVPFIPKRGPASPPSSQTHLVQNPNPYGGQKRPEHRFYVPRIYGFKVSERSRSGPRMAWLRMRPGSHSDLAMVDSKGRWIADSDDSSDDQDDSAHRGPRERFDDVSFAVLWLSGDVGIDVSLNRARMMKKILKKTKRRKRTTNLHHPHPQHSYREDDPWSVEQQANLGHPH